MLDPNVLLDKLILTLRSNTELVTALGGQASSIYAYTWENADGTNLDIAVQSQPVPSVMACWVGTRTGSYANRESVKHDYQLYLKPDDTITIGALFRAIRDGECTVPETRKFKLLCIDVGVNPPDSISCQPATRLIAAGYATYDYPTVGFTLIERGFDG